MVEEDWGLGRVNLVWSGLVCPRSGAVGKRSFRFLALLPPLLPSSNFFQGKVPTLGFGFVPLTTFITWVLLGQYLKLKQEVSALDGCTQQAPGHMKLQVTTANQNTGICQVI